MFKTIYNFRNLNDDIVSNSGNVDEPHFVLDDKGFPVIDEVRNNHEFINSWRESTDLAILLQKYSAGDVSALNQKPLIYGDFSEVPNNLADWVNVKDSAELCFEALPDNIKALFKDAKGFYESVASSDWLEKVNSLYTNESEVNTDGTSTKSE